MNSALVTGSTRGLGKAIADELGRRDYQVITSGTSGGDIRCDVTRYPMCKKMAHSIQARYEHLDLLVCNAGITRDRTLAKMTPVEWREVIDTNLTGVYNVINTHLSLMRNGSSIIIVGSKAADGNVGQANYAAAKAGLRGLAATLELELGRKGITVYLVEPGLVRTSMLDAVPESVLAGLVARFGPIAEPEDAARDILKTIK